MKIGFFKRSLCLIALLLAFCLAFAGCDMLSGNDNSDLYSETKQTQKQTNKKTEKITAEDVESDEESGSDGDKVTEETEKESTKETAKESADESTQPSKGVGDQRNAEKELGVPEFSGSPYAELNGNVPEFTRMEKYTTKSYELYSALDSLGRCGYAMACVGKDIMPTEDRESISSVKPSGWINKKYDTELVDGGYIYNRCHLIGFQLTGENANKHNLITGTRYMNVDGMLPFENMIADYVKETGNHVMYRVTPIYDGNDLVACGVKLEAYSVEDEGEEISFNVYVYNVQPGIVIDYATGNSWLSGESIETTKPTDSEDENGEERSFVLNTSSKKIHLPTCSGVESMNEANKQAVEGHLEDYLNDGYVACGICKPAA